MILNVNQLYDYKLATFVFQSIYGLSQKFFVKFLQGILHTTVVRLEIWMIWYMNVAALRGQVLVLGLLDQ